MNTIDRKLPGWGDAYTWPACTNHPNDPRTPEPSDTEEGIRYAFESVEELIGRAERCLANGEFQAAIDLSHQAGDVLRTVDWA